MTALRLLATALTGSSLVCLSCGGGGGGGDAAAPAPSVSSRSPAPGATESTAAVVTVVFTEPMDAASLAAGLTVSRTGGDAIAGTVAVAGDTAVFTPTVAWPAAASVTVTLSPEVRSARGGRLGTPQAWAFASAHWRALSAAGAPTARAGHTAVWTGAEMVVWGGAPTTLAGGRYDPSTDTWQATAVAGAPAGRTGHTAVWTGTEMIVWGGTVGGVAVAGGGRYDPATNSWRTVSAVGAPSARAGHTAVWTGTEMIVWGGVRDLSGGRYDPALDTWTPMSLPGAPLITSDHRAAWTGSRMAVWGGTYLPPPSDGGAGVVCLDCTVNTGALYDPATDTWTALAEAGAPLHRMSHALVWTGAELLVTGGAAGGGGRYAPETDTWLPMADAGAPSMRRLPHVAWTGTKLLVWSGYEPQLNNGAGAPIPGGALFDPSTDSWSPAPEAGSAPSLQRGSASAWTGTELIVWGGESAGGARYTP